MMNEECRITRRLTGGRLGLRWQSEAETPPSLHFGAASRFPPQSMTLLQNPEVLVGARISFLHSSFFILHSRVSA
jgi:hypothetical protein